jgi:BMFP domain-containing protein YqiC
MKPKEKVLDDIARMAGGAVSIMSGLTRQAREEIRARVDEMATRLDLVPREDFDRLEVMLAEARKEQTALRKRIEALESQGKKTKSASKTKTGAKGKKK